MHEKLITSVAPVVTGIVKLAVVVVLDDSPPIKSAGVVLSCAEHVQPLGAVNPVAPFIVTITVQTFAPSVNVPAVAPPVVAETEQPEVVNFVPLEMTPLVVVLPPTVKAPA